MNKLAKGKGQFSLNNISNSKQCPTKRFVQDVSAQLKRCVQVSGG